MTRKIRLLFLIVTLWQGCSDSQPFLRKPLPDHAVQPGDPNLRPDHAEVLTFYVLGDWGTGDQNQKAVAKGLRENVATIPGGRRLRPFVLGLGDNVYEVGLAEGWDNPLTTELLEETFGHVYSEVKYQGQPLLFHMIPGNHDHSGEPGGKNGWGDVIHQETTAEKMYPNWKYYPIDPSKNSDTDDSTNYRALKQEDILRLAVPEKLQIETDGSVAILALDTQVLLDLYERNDEALLETHWQQLESLLAEEANWKIIIGHHPVRSHGKHGGFRSAFWWIPPIALVTIVDKLFVKSGQDLDHAANKQFQEDLVAIMKKHQVSFYLAGHEHSLQFLEIDRERFQIISGSAAKSSGVTHAGDTFFSHSARGFVRFDVVQTEAWIEFFEVDVKTNKHHPTGLFRILK